MACGLHWSTPCSWFGPQHLACPVVAAHDGVTPGHTAFPSRLFNMLVKIVPRKPLVSVCGGVSRGQYRRGVPSRGHQWSGPVGLPRCLRGQRSASEIQAPRRFFPCPLQGEASTDL